MSIHIAVFNVYYAGFWLFSSAYFQADAVDHDDPLSLLSNKFVERFGRFGDEL